MPKLSDGTQMMQPSGTAAALQYEIVGLAPAMTAHPTNS
ncbi:hypothetical protein ACS15_2288 [Ralstonia insidiosa]|uniref:Uncharacterized protein n=1 Tax=Ralstonia insidiosa TaxID=190721 RepID=A0AAC9BG25_9RALS|nr:hypothetical protein ACS15_2288 [Ralstonia insidiosa]